MKIILPVLLGLALAFGAGAEQIEGVPFFRQETHQCGQASLASILGFYHRPVDMDRLMEATYSEALKGSLMADLENYAKGMGFKTESGQGTAQKLKDSVLTGHPVIVLIDHGIWLAAKTHYIVIIGFTQDGFLAHDGSRPSVLFPYNKFLQSWNKMGNPYLLIYP